MMNIKEIEIKLNNGEKVFTGEIDFDGQKIYLGDKLININNSLLTYEVRVRREKFVVHTGGCYSELTNLISKKLRVNNNITLRHANAFNSKLID